jgi:hypothetical protein
MPSHSVFSNELFWTCLKWLIITATWGVLAFGIYRKDRTWRQMLDKPLQESDVSALLKMFYKRNLQLWILVTLITIVVAAGDIRRDMASQQPATVAAITIPQTPVATITPTENTSPQASLPLPAASPLPYMDITEFNEKDSKEQAYIDVLKGRYEAWLVTYFYLHKCGKADAQDLNLIQDALQKELTTVHADNSVSANVMMAATGSYNEMYSGIPCDNAHLTSSKTTYDANMQQLKTQTPPSNPTKP